MKSQTPSFSSYSNSEYQQFYKTLLTLFEQDENKHEKKITVGWAFLSYIPKEAFKPMIKIALEKWDSWPRNWVKNVKEVYELWRTETKHTALKYNEQDDPRFPVEKMHTALDILTASGRNKFDMYCRDEHMPKTDIDRVIQKHRVLCGDGGVDINKVRVSVKQITTPNFNFDINKRMAVLEEQKKQIIAQEYDDEVPF